MDQPTVFVVASNHDHSRLIAGMISSIDVAVRGHRSPEEFRASYDSARPGCLVFEQLLAGMSGVGLHESLGHRDGLHPTIIIATAQADVPQAVSAVKHGVFDYLEFPLQPERLWDAIAEAIASDAKARLQIEQFREIEDRLALLTHREREVLERVVQGLLNKEIASELGISPRTVEVHRAHAVKKLGVGSVAQLVRLVLQHRITEHQPSQQQP
ncbi:MAG: response regulator transcription factor [Planctomycetes bacterium]|nr:response regulator transcription factor [Planctomycetota bacterium]